MKRQRLSSGRQGSRRVGDMRGPAKERTMTLTPRPLDTVAPLEALPLAADPLARPPLAAALEVAGSMAPSGVTIRAWRDPSDFDRMIAVFHAAQPVDGTGWEITTESLEADLRSFGMRADASILIAEARGETVGFGRVTDFGWSPDAGRLLIHGGQVVPSWRRRGIGRALLAGLQTELRRIRASRPDAPGSSAGYESLVFGTNHSTIALLTRDGYRPRSHMIEMSRPLDDVPTIALPDGITTRPVEPEDVQLIANALNEAMRDHRGWPVMTEEQVRAMVDGPVRGQTEMWQVAWAGDRVVGGVLGYIDTTENAMLQRRRGYTEGIFTVRDWRGRGVASAMIAQNLRVLRERGMAEAALSVDTENPTGALGLYERHGFRESARMIIFNKALDPAG
jgi:mycothiol synthase